MTGRALDREEDLAGIRAGFGGRGFNDMYPCRLASDDAVFRKSRKASFLAAG